MPNFATETALNSEPSLSQLMFGDGTPKKAFLTALVIGTILTAINHGDAILIGLWPPMVKVVLTYCVPYCVTTWGAVTGKKAQWIRSHEARGGERSVEREAQ